MVHMENSLEMPVRQLLQIMQDRVMQESTYFGIKTLKSPIDFWVYQEILYKSKPDVIVEIGNFHGGSTLALAHVCDCLGKGMVLGIDLSHRDVPAAVRAHPRVSLFEGDACGLFDRVARRIGKDETVLIIEDSSHTYENTLRVLQTYSALVKPGGYFIVEDGICHHGLEVGPKPGPFEAIETFLEQNSHFTADRSCESFLVTWNPKGYLKRAS
jgi:cephalosporin hydroxylase